MAAKHRAGAPSGLGPADSEEPHTAREDWKQFVIRHGAGARGDHLAHLLGVPAEDVARLRAKGVCTPLPRALHFGELFALRHGRAPRDDEWPLPRKFAGGYEWLAPERALLASLAGTASVQQLSKVLTARLRAITGDPHAARCKSAVQQGIQRVGLQASDVVGGIPITVAAKEIGGSRQAIYHAIEIEQLKARKIGRLWVLDRASWQQWKQGRSFPPEGYVLLASLKEPLGVRSDKLSEFARMGYVPSAVQCNPYGTSKGTQFGIWYVSAATAAALKRDRHLGRPMPWHGKPMMDNLRATWRTWQERKHPEVCPTCRQIWGEAGAPADFDAYVRRYPGLAHGAKRHLTMPWSPGLTLQEVAAQARVHLTLVLKAIVNASLEATSHDGELYVSRTEATRWIARKCPDGEGAGSWVCLDVASERYSFTKAQLKAWIADGTLRSKIGDNGPMRGIQYVMRQQCARLRNDMGYTHEQAAAQLGISVERLKPLLEGAHWRQDGLIPQATVSAVRKRLQSQAGWDVQAAAEELGVELDWVEQQIRRGTVRVSQAPWDRRRRYLSAPMMQRLRAAQACGDSPAGPPAHWLRQQAAAALAGVSPATLLKWVAAGNVAWQDAPAGRVFNPADVRAQARVFWKNPRLTRARPPAWMTEQVPREESTEKSHHPRAAGVH